MKSIRKKNVRMIIRNSVDATFGERNDEKNGFVVDSMGQELEYHKMILEIAVKIIHLNL